MSGEAAPAIWKIAGALPDAIALEDHRGPTTWADLEAGTNALAHGLEGLGLAPGDHVALLASNRTEFLLALIGSLRAGMIVTPLKTSWTAEEVGYVLADAGTKALVTDVDAGRQAGAAAGIAVVDLDRGLQGRSFESWLGVQPSEPLPRDRRGWRMSYTSGTTGRPKGVRRLNDGQRPWCDAFAASRAFTDILKLPTDGTHLVVSALFLRAPLAFSLSLVAAGFPLRILRRWDADAALDELERAVRSTCMVPTMFRQLLALPAARRAAFTAPELRCVLHGGEPCPQPLKREMIDWLGPILVEYYGMTEGGLSVATSAEWLERPGTVGRPVLGMELEILGPDGEPLPAGRHGTIYFRPPGGRYFEYRNAPEKTDAAYSKAGAFTVGDIGFVDADGYLFISGRTSDVIVSGGVNLYPAEIEDLLYALPEVREACVVGGPDDLRGETPIAFVVLDRAAAGSGTAAEERALAAIEAACEQRLAGYQRPRRFIVRDELPRDPTGKLLRHVVRAELWVGRKSNFAAES